MILGGRFGGAAVRKSGCREFRADGGTARAAGRKRVGTAGYPCRVEPVRTCLGCRGRENKADLIRLVGSDGAVSVDVRQRAPGRGGYLHPRPECWELALRKRSLARALGVTAIDRTALLSRLSTMGPALAGEQPSDDRPNDGVA